MRIHVNDVNVPGATLFVVCGCEEAYAIRKTFQAAYYHDRAIWIACFNDDGEKLAEFKSDGDGFVTDDW